MAALRVTPAACAGPSMHTSSSTVLTTRRCVVGRRIATPNSVPRTGSSLRQQSSLQVRSIPVSGPGSTGGAAGQVTAEVIAGMKAKIGQALETDNVQITDVYGDGRHVAIDVVSKVFEDKNAMQRQRLVYKAIWMELQETVHAVDTMTTKTPAEAGL